jgi:hypothetical protein
MSFPPPLHPLPPGEGENGHFTSSSSSQIRRKLMTKEQFMKLATFKKICRQLILVILVVLLQTGTLFTKAAEAA